MEVEQTTGSAETIFLRVTKAMEEQATGVYRTALLEAEEAQKRADELRSKAALLEEKARGWARYAEMVKLARSAIPRGMACALLKDEATTFRRMCEALSLKHDEYPGEVRADLESQHLFEGFGTATLEWHIDEKRGSIDPKFELWIRDPPDDPDDESLALIGPDAWAPSTGVLALSAKDFTRIPGSAMTFKGRALTGTTGGACAVITGKADVTIVEKVRMSLYALFSWGEDGPVVVFLPGRRGDDMWCIDVSFLASRLGAFPTELPGDDLAHRQEGIVLAEGNYPLYGTAKDAGPDGVFWSWDQIAARFVAQIDFSKLP